MTEQLRIGIVNSKGGVSKTTTCVYLARAAIAAGYTVDVRDLDKQGSATSWLQKVEPIENLTVTVANAHTMNKRGPADVVIFDTSPADPRDIELVAASSDFVVVPSVPGELNDERTAATVQYLADRGVAHAVVLVQTNDRTRATRGSRERLLANTSVFDTEIPHREAIRNAVGTWPDELHGYDELFTEIAQEVTQ